MLWELFMGLAFKKEKLKRKKQCIKPKHFDLLFINRQMQRANLIP